MPCTDVTWSPFVAPSTVLGLLCSAAILRSPFALVRLLCRCVATTTVLVLSTTRTKDTPTVLQLAPTIPTTAATTTPVRIATATTPTSVVPHFAESLSHHTQLVCFMIVFPTFARLPTTPPRLLPHGEFKICAIDLRFNCFLRNYDIKISAPQVSAHFIQHFLSSATTICHRVPQSQNFSPVYRSTWLVGLFGFVLAVSYDYGNMISQKT